MRSRQERSEQSAKEYFLEQAAAYFDEMKHVAENAPHGQTFDRTEAFVMQQGRELLRQSFEAALQEQIDDFEKKNETTLCPKCQKKKRHSGYRPKERISSTGTITLQRRYDECLPCKLPEHVADARFGLEGRYSIGLRRLAVFSATNESYRKGSEALEEFLGIKLSYNTVRELCQQESPKMDEWYLTSQAVRNDFIQTPGVIEISTDGTCVNTTEGPREVKVGLISKREQGESALPEQWEDRKLPSIGACVAFAAIEEKDQFRKHFTQWRTRLQLGSTGDISVLADGALWIWDLTKQEFGRVRGCLDIYHALEHLSKTGKVLYGDGTAAYEKWREETKWELLESGFEKIEKRLNELEKGLKAEETQKKESLRLLRGYLENNRERLRYRERLAEGRAIGSGQVEGACKNLIGKRLKQTWAEWKVENLNRMATICAIRYGEQWKNYWKAARMLPTKY
jgi:hypothetical protein